VDEFRQAMRWLAGGVTVVTTASGVERAGLTATAVCSLSMNPPRILACVNLSGMTYRLLSQSRRMVVNVLGTQHQDVAKRFGGIVGDSSDDRFTVHQWDISENCAPKFKDAISWIECNVDEMVLTRTHAIVIGEVIKVGGAGASNPLIYLNGSFCGVVQSDRLKEASV